MPLCFIRRVHTTIAIVFITISSCPTKAELQDLSEADLSGISGQAYFSVDQYQNPSQEEVHYTRLNLGMDVDIQANADKVELGRYERIDVNTGKPEEKPADIIIDQFSLGISITNNIIKRTLMFLALTNWMEMARRSFSRMEILYPLKLRTHLLSLLLIRMKLSVYVWGLAKHKA